MNEGVMADHTPSLESGRLSSSNLPVLSGPPPATMVNGDGPQQVILVQVNAGEAFTIRRDDGQYQCITGPAHVPMMSPNGSVPPIYVPPGYVSQIIEENGVRHVMVLPQPEFHPGSHSPLHPGSAPPPSSHLASFMAHPVMLPQPLPVYPGAASGGGDLTSQFIPQYHPVHFCEQDSHSSHPRATFVPRDERTSKTYERLQKKISERQAGGSVMKDKSGTPPSSPQKSPGTGSWQDVRNGTGHGQEQAGASGTGRGKKPELDEKSKAFQVLLSAVNKPAVTDIRARAATLTWTRPSASESKSEDEEADGGPRETFSYEVSISNSGKDGTYKTAYSGEELSVTLGDLRPATDYHARVQALCGSVQGFPSEPVSFTTLSCEPDAPIPPRKSSGTKNTLVLQWKAPCDNGSKIQNYILQWDEGKGAGEFEQCYYGPQKQHRVTKLAPASRYSFRLAAKNDLGTSGFSDAVELFTSYSVPAPPPAPELLKAEVTLLCVQWQRPASSPKEDDIRYNLEMEEDGSGYGFQPTYDGEDLSFTVRNLRRSTKYKFRVAAYNSEGKSNPSQVSEFATLPDAPAPPCRLAVKGRPQPSSFRLIWESPKDDGGSEVTKYIVELSEGTVAGALWNPVYTGSATEHVCDGLKPGCTYQTRVCCVSEGGQSMASAPVQVETPAVAPGPCPPPRLSGKAKARELLLRWGPPQVDGGGVVSCYSLEMVAAQTEEYREVYQGPELDCTVSGLLPGTTYSFSVRAANKAGYGPSSERCDVTTSPGAPDACRLPLVVCKSPTSALIKWESPHGNGAPVTEYRLEWGMAEGVLQACYSGPALSHEVRSLHPATYYYCRVQAVNLAGAGAFSDVAVCQTPCSVPGPVSSIHTLRVDGAAAGEEEEDDDDNDSSQAPGSCYCPSSCLGLRWEPPCDNGAEITSYCIDLGDRQPITVGPVTRYVIKHLQPDTTYRIRIQALNSLGAGPFSHTVRLKTKPLPPAPPRLDCITFSHQTLKLRWGEGGAKASPSDPVQYQLQMQDRTGRFVPLYKGPCHTHKVQRLNESTSYTFRIQAFNEAGEGPFSDSYTFTTPLSPPPPLKAPRIERLDDQSCEVTWEAVPSMKGDPVIYTLQCMMGNAVFKQVYKGPDMSFHVSGLQPNSEHRFRVCAIRQCQSALELTGPFSASTTLSLQRTEAAVSATVGSGSPVAGSRVASTERARRSLSDEQCAALILLLFAIISILIAFVIQYFVIK